MPMSEYEKARLMPEVIGNAKREEIEKQPDQFRAAALNRLQKAIRYAQMQKMTRRFATATQTSDIGMAIWQR